MDARPQGLEVRVEKVQPLYYNPAMSRKKPERPNCPWSWKQPLGIALVTVRLSPPGPLPAEPPRPSPPFWEPSPRPRPSGSHFPIRGSSSGFLSKGRFGARSPRGGTKLQSFSSLAFYFPPCGRRAFTSRFGNYPEPSLSCFLEPNVGIPRTAQSFLSSCSPLLEPLVKQSLLLHEGITGIPVIGD
jgi:hypothetical protein